MAEEAAPMIEVPEVEEVAYRKEDGDDEGDSPDGGNSKSKKGKKSRKWAAPVNLADFYAPKAYTPDQKGGKGERKGGKGGKDGEGGGKGKGKVAYGAEGESAAKPDGGGDPTIPQPSVTPGLAPAEGAPMDQAKGGASAKKKQMGGAKNREGGGKGGNGGNKGNPQQPQQQQLQGGGKAPQQGQQAPRKGNNAGKGQGGPRPMSTNEMMPDMGQDVEGARPPGPQQQQRLPAGMPGKGGAPQGAIVGMPMAAPTQYPYGMPYPAPYGQMGMAPYGQPGMPAMYALPYYVMQQAQQPFQGMPGMPMQPAPIAQPPPMTGADRVALLAQLQQQIEYYFGMENLLKDVYLRKHMTDDGWVPIALLAGFRRIQDMTADMAILMEAVTTSEIVEVNPQSGQHIRLRNDWPRWILAPQTPGSPAAAAAPPSQAPATIRSNP